MTYEHNITGDQPAAIPHPPTHTILMIINTIISVQTLVSVSGGLTCSGSGGDGGGGGWSGVSVLLIVYVNVV